MFLMVYNSAWCFVDAAEDDPLRWFADGQPSMADFFLPDDALHDEL